METPDLTALTQEEIAQHILKLQPGDLPSCIQKMSNEQIAAAITVLDEDHDPAWRAKLKAAVHGLTETPKLEAVGKALTVQQVQELFDSGIFAETSEAWKLSPLLVGITHLTFNFFLRNATPVQMQYLLQEAVTEPVQHHLTVITHGIIHRLPTLAEQLELLERDINTINFKELGIKEIVEVMVAIEHLHECYEDSLAVICKILALAWNTNRADLIDKLSIGKEICQKFILNIIGHSRNKTSEPTGLYAKIEERLNGVFGNPDDPNDIEAAENDEPALEAMVKFSIWYLRDYWDIGLLPTIVDPLLFEHISYKIDTPQAQNTRIMLLENVKSNLDKLGLGTVADLKRAGIYSRKMLEEYIARRRHVLAR